MHICIYIYIYIYTYTYIHIDLGLTLTHHRGCAVLQIYRVPAGPFQLLPDGVICIQVHTYMYTHIELYTESKYITYISVYVYIYRSSPR